MSQRGCPGNKGPGDVIDSEKFLMPLSQTQHPAQQLHSDDTNSVISSDGARAMLAIKSVEMEEAVLKGVVVV